MLDLKPTVSQIERTTQEYSAIAKEPVTIEFICGTLYAFGSELACLRLGNHMRANNTARVAYSTNLKTWYYTHEAK